MSGATPAKRDLLKELKAEYCQPKMPQLVEPTRGDYLAMDGRGGPGGDAFQGCMEALYGMAYTIKFARKAEGADFVVPKLEGLYGIGMPAAKLAALPQEQWDWRMLIRMPDGVTATHLHDARAALQDKGKQADFDAVRLEPMEEGSCVQMLHVGPYEEEQRTLDAMLEFCAESQLQPYGWHHEVYLSDPRRVPPERLKTILRLPVRKG
jgi:hypothetical protein